MKKRGPVKKKDNVFFFPELEKRLTEKGIESLQTKKYTEAIRFLEEARELDPENGDILIGLVLAYFETASYQKAKALANEILLKGMGEYFQMVELYLTILIQLHEYKEIVSTIEALMDEKEIPSDKIDHFSTILQFSRRMADNHQSANETEIEDGLQEEPVTIKLNLLSLHDPKEQMLLISKLAEKNIRPYVPDIQAYLKLESGHPFLKTVLLNLLKEQEYEKEVIVCKFNLERICIPFELPEIRSQLRMKEIVEILNNRLENSDPVLFENIKSLVERHFFMIYPFSFEPISTNVWAAAFHFIALEYYGTEPNISDLTIEYCINSNELVDAMDLIKEIDEISYPII